MNEEIKWVSDLPARLYLHNALWAVVYCQIMYVTVCTPSDPGGEFILTDDCYHISKSPNNNTSSNL